MSAVRGRRLLLALLVGVSLPAQADPPARRVDRHGDPLPDGAVARFGTERYRAPGGAALGLSDDGAAVTAVGARAVVRRFDAAGRLTAARRVASDFGLFDHLSPDGRWFVGVTEHDPRRVAALWDLAAGRRVGEVSVEDVGGTPLSAHVLPGGRAALLLMQTQEPDAFRSTVWRVDFAAGRRERLFAAPPQPDFHRPTLDVSPDGRLAVVSTGTAAPLCWDLAAGRERWRGAEAPPGRPSRPWRTRCGPCRRTAARRSPMT
jgi:hypothetical protein